MTVREKVYGYKTKHPEGFTNLELETLLQDYPNLNKEKFDYALMGITCMVKDGEVIIYHCDIESAINCGIENRNITLSEFD